MNENNYKIENLSDGLLVLTNSISELYNQLSGINLDSITEGKIIILSMINQIIVQDDIDIDSQKIFEMLKTKFIQSLTSAEFTKIRTHTNSVFEFLDQRIWLYNSELKSINEAQDKLQTFTSYCMYVDPLGYIDFSIQKNEIEFNNKYNCKNLEYVATLNFLNNAIFNDIKKIIIEVFVQF